MLSKLRLSLPNLLKFTGILVILCSLLHNLEQEESVQIALTAQVAARDVAKEVNKQYPAGLTAEWSGEESAKALVKEELERQKTNVIFAASPNQISLLKKGSSVELTISSPNQATIQKARHLGGWGAIMPPILAVLIALIFRKLILALASAVWLGATLLANNNPLQGLWDAAYIYVWKNLTDTFNMYIIVFTLSLVGMVQVMTRMGGVRGVLNLVSKWAVGRRSTQLATVAMGGAIFFDDYANTVVVGTTMRPLTDARRISREKLAYLVDSTSAPIAGVAIISTWIGYEVGLFGDLSQQLGLTAMCVANDAGFCSGYDIFFSVLPLRFYCLFTLAFVLLIAGSGRDYGPMLRAELRAAKLGQVMRPGAEPMTRSNGEFIEVVEGVDPKWWNAVIPIAVVLLLTFIGMFWSGWSNAAASIPALFSAPMGDIFSAWGIASADLSSWQSWRDAFSNADNAKVLFYAALSGSFVAILLASTQRIMKPTEAIKTWLAAVPAMWMAVAILVLAWSIRAVCDDLGTNVFLVGAVQDYLSPAILPLITFLLAAAVAFATGTSWGTMGILLPSLIPLAFTIAAGDPNSTLILLLCFGAVLDGAIFGDHCSPISDTTVMSSIAANCDHVDHVKTQAPYAVTTMTIAAACGYLGVAMGLPVWAAYLTGIVGILTILFLLGKRVHSSRPSPTTPSPNLRKNT